MNEAHAAPRQSDIDAVLRAWDAHPSDYPDVRDDAAIAIDALIARGWTPPTNRTAEVGRP